MRQQEKYPTKFVTKRGFAILLPHFSPPRRNPCPTYVLELYFHRNVSLLLYPVMSCTPLNHRTDFPRNSRARSRVTRASKIRIPRGIDGRTDVRWNRTTLNGNYGVADPSGSSRLAVAMRSCHATVLIMQPRLELFRSRGFSAAVR
jgi:hypothetical protein